ncbi:unnamed protein product [Clonostachys rosea]|uniref:ribonuclease H n=1 Tax=Bionectria ochroleuca TaxID=29856 RepID=A0ABY6U548_BIOOC|nr:unnamed protein product [Clonostachys rosea]
MNLRVKIGVGIPLRNLHEVLTYPVLASEAEDSPRTVLDIHGDFVICNTKPQIVLKLGELVAFKQQWGFDRLIYLRPVPALESIAHAKRAMGGDGSAGSWTGTTFNAPRDLSPNSLFPSRFINSSNYGMHLQRFCLRRRFANTAADLKTMAIYIDGACFFDGQASLQGGFAIVFNEGPDGVYGRQLENTGPSGQPCTPTGNRAELRAVIAALEFRTWWGEGFNRVVIVTDSKYVAKGATQWLRKWANNGWRTATGKPTANRDLWEMLSEMLRWYAEGGCEISFWMVPREWNTRADAFAKAYSKVAGEGEDRQTDGVLV